MSIVEETRGGLGPDDKVLIGIISVVPSTGDVMYDEFSGWSTFEGESYVADINIDTFLRTELEVRLSLVLDVRFYLRIHTILPAYHLDETRAFKALRISNPAQSEYINIENASSFRRSWVGYLLSFVIIVDNMVP